MSNIEKSTNVAPKIKNVLILIALGLVVACVTFWIVYKVTQKNSALSAALSFVVPFAITFLKEWKVKKGKEYWIGLLIALVIFIVFVILVSGTPEGRGGKGEGEVGILPTPVKRPSSADLDAIWADIEYPSSDDYLDGYMTFYVSSTNKGSSVYALHGLNDGGDWKKLALLVPDNTAVTAIAKHSYYDSSGKRMTYVCCLFNLNSSQRAGWINNSYLATKK